MTKCSRDKLAGYFSEGNMPTQEQFGDLVESMVNILDDEFDKSPQDGMKLAQLKSGNALVSCYDEITVGKPLWTIAFSMSGYDSGAANYKNFNIFSGSDKTGGLTLASAYGNEAVADKSNIGKIRVGINQNAPQHELDVNGVIAANGRMGRAEGKIGATGKIEKEVPADGEWYPIISGLDGCQAFEIMAGVGKKNSGRYALLHAFALNTFNTKKNNITYHQAHYASRCDQIELRWIGDIHDYTLQMRTRCKYFEPTDTEKILIRFYITQLWFDPLMDNCSGKNSPDAPVAA